MDTVENLISDSRILWSTEEEQVAIEVLQDTSTGIKRPRKHYYIKSKFQLTTLAGVTKVMKLKNNRVMATKESVYSIIKDIHVSIGHGGERKTFKKISENYANIPRTIVEEFIRNCERCIEKARRKEISSGTVVKPILVKSINDRAQIDLVDMQSLPDGNYKFIMHYQEHLSKYHILRPLRTKRAAEVAFHLLHIFIDFGAPTILQSDNGREFTANVIQVIKNY